MAKQIINIGQTANDKSGDPLRTAFTKVNQNFTEIYDALGGVSFSQVNSDWNALTGVAQILNKPAIPTDVSDLTDTTNLLAQGIEGLTVTQDVGTTNVGKSLTENNNTIGSRLQVSTNEIGLEQYVDPDGLNNNQYGRVRVSSNGVQLEISQEYVGGISYGRLDIAPTGAVISSSDGISTNSFLFDGSALVLPNNGIIQQRQSYVRTTDGTVTAATPSVVWTGLLNTVSGIKLNIQVEGNETGDATGWHCQSCEAIIASRGFANAGPGVGDPQMTVYGVIHTSVNPLVTFTVRRNVANIVEVVATPTATADQTTPLYTKIYSVEMLTRD